MFFKEVIQNSNKYRKYCLTSLITRAMQIKTARCHFTTVRIAKTKHRQ